MHHEDCFGSLDEVVRSLLQLAKVLPASPVLLLAPDLPVLPLSHGTMRLSAMSDRELMCGVDEAGRGPLAGPVFAAVVILDLVTPIAGLADSKQLSEPDRAALASEIKARAVAWAVASASVEEIDALNILRASLLAMRRAVESLTVMPREVLVDGLHCPMVGIPARAVTGGDATVAAIAAASILAKVARDGEMLNVHALHPCYGFDRHKGYSTPDHLQALRRYGVCSAHRRSFAPVQAVLNPGFWP